MRLFNDKRTLRRIIKSLTQFIKGIFFTNIFVVYRHWSILQIGQRTNWEYTNDNFINEWTLRLIGVHLSENSILLYHWLCNFLDFHRISLLKLTLCQHIQLKYKASRCHIIAFTCCLDPLDVCTVLKRIHFNCRLLIMCVHLFYSLNALRL